MSAHFERFKDLLNDLDLLQTVYPILEENGFDDWEAISYLNPQNLQEIGK